MAGKVRGLAIRCSRRTCRPPPEYGGSGVMRQRRSDGRLGPAMSVVYLWRRGSSWGLPVQHPIVLDVPDRPCQPEGGDVVRFAHPHRRPPFVSNVLGQRRHDGFAISSPPITRIGANADRVKPVVANLKYRDVGCSGCDLGTVPDHRDVLNRLRQVRHACCTATPDLDSCAQLARDVRPWLATVHPHVDAA